MIASRRGAIGHARDVGPTVFCANDSGLLASSAASSTAPDHNTRGSGSGRSYRPVAWRSQPSTIRMTMSSWSSGRSYWGRRARASRRVRLGMPALLPSLGVPVGLRRDLLCGGLHVGPLRLLVHVGAAPGALRAARVAGVLPAVIQA